MDNTIRLRCKQCDNTYPADEFSHCLVCKIPLRDKANGQHVTQSFEGNHNQGVQVGGNNQAPITINPAPPEPKKTLIHREKNTPISIAGTPVKHWWFSIIGALGVIGNLASIAGLWFALDSSGQPLIPTFPIWTLPLFFFLLSLGLGLWQIRYLKLPLTSRTIEIDKHGALFLTQVSGICRECDSPVEIGVIGSKENRTTVVRCTNNPRQHRWEFDRTILGDVGEDYRS